MNLDAYRGVWKTKRGKFGAAVSLALKKMLTALFTPEFFCETMIYEFTAPQTTCPLTPPAPLPPR